MKEVVLVVGNAANLAAGDEELLAILEDDLQFFVDTVEDQDRFRDVVDPNFQGLVVVSSSINIGAFDDVNQYNRARIPALVMSDDVLPEFEMTDNGAQDARVLNARELVVIDENHPIAKGVGGRGRINITNNNNNQVTVGRLETRTAEIVVGADNSRQNVAIGCYPFGAEMARVDNSRNTQTAPARRCMAFARENIIEDLEADASTLLRNTILYTWAGTVD